MSNKIKFEAKKIVAPNNKKIKKAINMNEINKWEEKINEIQQGIQIYEQKINKREYVMDILERETLGISLILKLISFVLVERKNSAL